MNGHPLRKQGQNPAYRPSGTITTPGSAMKAARSICLERIRNKSCDLTSFNLLWNSRDDD
jgi:hypothetical protein